MKVAGQRRFWSLRPTLTAGRLEFGCWLVAGLLAVTLAISPSVPARPSAPQPGIMGVRQAADLLAYRQQCIDQVLSSDLGMTEEYVLGQINRQCSTLRRIAASPVVPICIRVFVGEARRVPGCKTV
ncbi:MAG TPA: hypothetical protein VN834_08635 [Candidatus Acidoferrum sp.]|nr:hypothetical protein [Candidatus Acidoferrum sp.]